MDRKTLQASASEWARQAKNDIRNKVMEFMDEMDTSREELAYALAISDGELEQILSGNGEITLTTLAKLLIATGNALEIKPVEETPLEIDEFGAPIPPENEEDRVPPLRKPWERDYEDEDDDENIFDSVKKKDNEGVKVQPRGSDGRFKPWPKCDKEKCCHEKEDEDIDAVGYFFDCLRHGSFSRPKESPSLTELKDKLRRLIEDNPNLLGCYGLFIG